MAVAGIRGGSTGREVYGGFCINQFVVFKSFKFPTESVLLISTLLFRPCVVSGLKSLDRSVQFGTVKQMA